MRQIKRATTVKTSTPWSESLDYGCVASDKCVATTLHRNTMHVRYCESFWDWCFCRILQRSQTVCGPCRVCRMWLSVRLFPFYVPCREEPRNGG